MSHENVRDAEAALVRFPKVPTTLTQAIRDDSFLTNFSKQAFTIHYNIVSWARKHKTQIVVAAIGVSILTFSVTFLPLLGFSAIGPAAASFAAGWQASMGSVAAGSVFSFLQSAAMGGAATGLFTGLGITGGMMMLGAMIPGITRKLGNVSMNMKVAWHRFSLQALAGWGTASKGAKDVSEKGATLACQVGSDAANSAKDAFNTATPHVQEFGIHAANGAKDALNGAKDAFNAAAPHVQEFGINAANGAKDAFNTATPHVHEFGINAANGAKDAFNAATPHVQEFGINASNAAKDLGYKISEGFEGSATKFKELLGFWTKGKNN